MSIHPCIHSSGLLLLRQAGILHNIAEMLDAPTLRTVICHSEEFCRSISMPIVERTLKELFGHRWRLYHEAYLACAHEQNARLGQNSSRPFETTCRGDHPWGLGYDICLPSDISMINGYVVLEVIQTLNAIAQNCDNYDYSFIPGEPSECGIDRMSFVENGRLIWIQYYPGSYDYRKNRDVDVINQEANFTVHSSAVRYARLHGQLMLRFEEPALAMVAIPGSQETCPKEVSGFENELWDLGARPHPRCLWSSLWDATFKTSKISVRDRVVPVTTFRSQRFEHFLLPSARGFAINFNKDVDLYSASVEPTRFPHKKSREPLRFVKCVSTLAVIDLMHLKPMQFHGSTELQESRLSRDSQYLGAIARTRDDDGDLVHHLAIWHVALPRPFLVWESGVDIPCDGCDWLIDQDWLIIVCRIHGIIAYRLTLSSPRAIELNPFVSYLRENMISLKICGVGNDILAFELPTTKTCAFIKFTEGGQGEWKAKPICLNSSTLPVGQTVSLGFKAPSYIHKIGKRYFLSTLGDLFDLGVACAPKETTTRAITLHPVNPKYWKVLAMWEVPNDNKAVTVCYDDRESEPDLMLCLMSSFGIDRQLTITGPSIHYKDTKFVVFSPNGQRVFVSPQNDSIGVWIIIIKDTSGNLQPEVYVKSLPHLSFSATSSEDERPTHDWGDVRYPCFLTDDTFALVRNSCKDTAIYEVGTESYASYDTIDKRIYLLRIDETLELECSLIGVPLSGESEHLRVHARRWVDVLREKTRDLGYCEGITFVGRRAALSPGHRFLLYPGERDIQLPAAPQVELCDLCSPNPKRLTDARRSWRAFFYAIRLRRDYRRVQIYGSSSSA